MKAKKKEREKMKQDLRRIIATTNATKAPKVHKAPSPPKKLNKTSPSANERALKKQQVESKTNPAAVSNQQTGNAAPRKPKKKKAAKLPPMPDWFTGED